MSPDPRDAREGTGRIYVPRPWDVLTLKTSAYLIRLGVVGKRLAYLAEPVSGGRAILIDGTLCRSLWRSYRRSAVPWGAATTCTAGQRRTATLRICKRQECLQSEVISSNAHRIVSTKSLRKWSMSRRAFISGAKV